MSDIFRVGLDKPERPDFKEGDAIRIEREGQVYLLNVEHARPIGDPEHPLFPLGYEIKGGAIVVDGDSVRAEQEG